MFKLLLLTLVTLSQRNKASARRLLSGWIGTMIIHNPSTGERMYIPAEKLFPIPEATLTAAPLLPRNTTSVHTYDEVAYLCGAEALQVNGVTKLSEIILEK